MRELITIPPAGLVTRQVMKTASFETLQSAVGGYIEVVPRSRRYEGRYCTVWCNEDGLAKGLPFNRRASTLFNQRLYGNIVIERPFKGETK